MIEKGARDLPPRTERSLKMSSEMGGMPMIRQFMMGAVVAIGMGHVLPGMARADTVPDAGLVQADLLLDELPCPSPCSSNSNLELFDFGSVNGGSNALGATGSISAAKNPFSVSTNLSASGNWDTDSVISAAYYIELVGPPVSSISTDIDLIVHTGALVQIDDGPIASAEGKTELTVSKESGGTIYTNGWGCGATNGITGLCTEPDFVGTVNVDLTPDTVYEIRLTANAETRLGNGTGESAFASIDPHIHIDASFADAAGYQLLISDGVGNEVGSASGTGNTPSVPEPSTLTLLGFTMAGIGAGVRRRRSQMS